MIIKPFLHFLIKKIISAIIISIKISWVILWNKLNLIHGICVFSLVSGNDAFCLSFVISAEGWRYMALEIGHVVKLRNVYLR